MRYITRIFFANVRNTFWRDTAFFAENWSNVLSTTLYTLTSIVALQIIYSNLDSIGGFNRNDMFFLMFVGQLSFYLQSRISFFPAIEFAEEINRGQLDFYLSRPVPHKFFIFTKSVSLLIMFRDAIPPILPMLFIIDWGALGLTTANVMAGLVIFILGLVIDHCLIYMLALTSIWSGSSNYTLNYFWAERVETRMPYENLYAWFKVVIFTAMPAFILGTLSVSVMLGRSPIAARLLLVGVATIIWVAVHNYMWRKAMLMYSSASS